MKTTKLIYTCAVAVILIGCNSSQTATSTETKDFSRTGVDADAATTVSYQKTGTTLTEISDLTNQLGGEWNFVNIGNKNVSTAERAYINLDLNSLRMYGCNGCNVINASLTASADGILSFGEIVSTRMSCPDSQTPEKTVMKVLEETTSFKIYDINGVPFLYLFNSAGSTLASLRRQNIDFINGAWTVEEINGISTSTEQVRLVIDTEQLKIHGNTGCNIVNGSIYIDPEKVGAVQFQELISTMKSCPDMQLETELLVALEETCYCQQVSESQIQLLNHDREVVVTLTRLDLSQR